MTETGEAELALAGVAADLIESISLARAAEIAASGVLPAPPRDWRDLGPLVLGLAEAANPDYRQHGVTPDRPGHEDRRRHCEICGSTRTPLVAGADGEDGAYICDLGHARECEARKTHRYPPRPDLVPEAVLSAVSAEDARLARLSAPAPAQQEEPEPEYQPYVYSNQYGAYDKQGGWHPAPDRFYADAWAASPWGHTLRNPAHHGHLLGPQAAGLYGHGTGRSAYSAAVAGQQAQRSAPGGQGGQRARREIPAEGLPEGVAAALEGGVGNDVQMQAPELPEGAPARPARRQRPRDRYGRRRVRWR